MQAEQWWAGTAGNDYLERNQVDYKSRVPFWQSAIEYCTPQTVLEVGCNRGHNLKAIQSIDPNIEVSGVDVNDKAVNEARSNGIQATLLPARSVGNVFERESNDLVFTAGVLIHVEPDELADVMRGIVDTSAKYVLAIEYEAEQATEIEYRGEMGKLWKRPYGKLYEDLGLRLLAFGNAEGFIDCTYWLLTKP